MTIKFNSAVQTAYLAQGEIRNEQLKSIVRDATGINQKLVYATMHTILSGAPGVGKTYTTTAELEANNIPYVLITAGMTEIEITMRLANGIGKLKGDAELVVVVDDADDVIFGGLKELNRWKIATADMNPYWSYPKDITNTLTKLEKAGRDVEAQRIAKFQVEGSLGLEIPLDRARFIVLCNTDLEDTSQVKKTLRSSVEAVLDRFEYERLSMPWQEKWGWLAHVLCNTQPFDEVTLSDEDKKEVLNFLYTNWNQLKSETGASYRFVRKLVDDMINYPDVYGDRWARRLK
jgi:hypothetical protein